MPKTNENNCDCDACQEHNIQEMSPKDIRFLEAMLLRNAVKKVKVTPEDIELAKGKAVVIGRSLAEDIWADQHSVKFVRLNQKENLLYSGKARMATSREIAALQ